jgi:hypothetical protein
LMFQGIGGDHINPLMKTGFEVLLEVEKK